MHGPRLGARPQHGTLPVRGGLDAHGSQHVGELAPDALGGGGAPNAADRHAPVGVSSARRVLRALLPPAGAALVGVRDEEGRGAEDGGAHLPVRAGTLLLLLLLLLLLILLAGAAASTAATRRRGKELVVSVPAGVVKLVSRGGGAHGQKVVIEAAGGEKVVGEGEEGEQAIQEGAVDVGLGEFGECVGEAVVYLLGGD